MAICSLCRLFEQQSKFISKQAKHLHGEASLSEDQKKKMEQALHQVQ
jgi:hypothetical protein